MDPLLTLNRSHDDLLTDARNTFDRIVTLPKHRITSDLETEISNWKSLIAAACLPLVLKPSQNLKFCLFNTPDSDYSIDLTATSRILPRRLEGEPREIDEITRAYRRHQEMGIERDDVICYRASVDGKFVRFAPCLSSPVNEYSRDIPVSRQLRYPNFLNDIKHCAHPRCREKIEEEEKHLQLCQHHGKELLFNIKQQWLSTASEKIYDAIMDAGEHDSNGVHHRIYYQLLPQLNTWIEQIDHLISIDCTGTGFQTSSIDAWRVLQLRPVRLLLMLMKSAIFVYRMHLNPTLSVMGAIIALIIGALESPEVKQAMVNGLVRVIDTVCGVVAAIFAYFDICILYTLDESFSNDANIAIMLHAIGGGLVIAGGAMAAVIATHAAVIGGIAVATVGLTSMLIGRRMRGQLERRGRSHAQLVQIHLDLKLAREKLWQWIK